LTAEADVLRSRVSELEANAANGGAAISEKDSLIAELRRDIEKLDGEAAASKKERDEAHAKTEKVISRVKELKAEMDARSSECESLKVQLSETESSKSNLENTLAVQKGKLIAKLRELKGVIDSKVSENEALGKRVEEMEAQCAALQLQLAAAEAARDESDCRLTAQLTSFEEEKIKMKADVEASIEKAKADRSKAIRRVKETNEAVREKEATIESLRSEISVLNDKIHELKNETAIKSAMAEDTNADSAKLEELILRVRTLSEELDASRNECASNKSLVDELTAKLAKHDEILHELNTEKLKLIEDANLAREKCTESESKVCRLEVVVDAKSAECERLNGALTMMKKDLSAALSVSANASTEMNQLKELNTTLSATIDDLKQSLEGRDTQIASYEDHVALLDGQLADCKKSIANIKDELLDKAATLDAVNVQLAQHESESAMRMAVPSSFEVLMRVDDGDQIWCLVSYCSSTAEAGGNRLEWKPEHDVLQWVESRNVDSESGFSIDVEDVDMPPTVQELLESQFDRERTHLGNRIVELENELTNSQKTFELYRDRARVSLKKTASDQKASDEKILQLTEKIKLQEAHIREAEDTVRKHEMHRMEAIKVLQDEIKKEKMLTQSLRQRIDECVIELSSIRAAEKELLKSLQTKDTAQEDVSSGPLLEKIEDLNDTVESLRVREQQLMQEIKKRGDLARQLCSAKDEEIRQLREKLHYDQKHHHNTSPVGRSRKVSSATPQKAVTPRHKDSTSTTLTPLNPPEDVEESPSGVMKEEKVELQPSSDTSTGPEGYSETENNCDDDDDEIQTLLDIARNQAQREIDISRDASRSTPSSAKELEKFKRLAVRLSDDIKALKCEISRVKNREGIHNSLSGGDEVREQRIMYLRNAFMGFVKAKEAVEVQHLGRVICTILNYPPEEQQIVNEAILKFAPAVVASSTMDTFSSQVTSFFEKSFF